MVYASPLLKKGDKYKQEVRVRRVKGKVKEANILAKAIRAFELSLITYTKLSDIYIELNNR